MPPNTERMWVTALTMSPVPGLALRPDHRRALGDAPQGLAEIRAAADERHGEQPLVDVVGEIGRRQHLGFVDVVDLEGLQDLRLGEMADAALRHHGNRDGLLDLLDHPRVGHARDPTVAADVGGNALERHDGARARFLGDLGLIGVDDVHDHAALQHLGKTALDPHRSDLVHAPSVARGLRAGFAQCDTPYARTVPFAETS